MSIPSQLPQIVTAARSGALQALALQAGQMLDGKVIGPAPNGGTQVQIGGQMLNLVLPLLVKAGETLKFEVQGSGAQVKLALQPAPVPAATTSLPAGSPAPMQAQPNTLPLPPGQPAVAAPQGQPLTAQPSAPPASAPTTATASPTASSATTLPIAVTPGAASPTPPSAPSMPAVAVPASVPSSQQQALIPAAPTIAAAAQPAGRPVATGTGQQAAAAAPVPPMPQQQPYPAAAPRNAVAAHPLPAATAQPIPTQAAVAANLPSATPVPTAATAQLQPSVTPMPATPQAAVAQMVQAALPRQGSITGLTAALTSIAGKVALPEPVVRAAQQVLAGRVAIDGGNLDAAALQRAVLRSGVFQEAALARPGSPLLAPQTDMKSALLALRQTLTNWVGQQAPLAPVSQIPPPIRGHVPRARASDAPPIDPKAAPEEVGKQLLERTEAALSRVRLHQSASLPDPIAKTADWSMDLPVLIGQQQNVLQLQIHRDEHNGSEAAAERGWQMRFAINLPGMGEVGAQVSLRGGTTGVMLWATERGTSEALEADAVSLREALASAGLNPGAVIVRHGEPPAPPPAPSGHFVDAST